MAERRYAHNNNILLVNDQPRLIDIFQWCSIMLALFLNIINIVKNAISLVATMGVGGASIMAYTRHDTTIIG